VKIFGAIKAVFEFINSYFKSVVFVTILVIYIVGSIPKDGLEIANVAEIEITGAIFDVTKTLKEIKQVSEDENIKGVLINVDSPGGSVSKSIELADAIKRLKAKKRVVVYASGMLTSGSYYASIWADEIVANSGSIVGSIGVIFQGANLEELFSKLGVKSQNQTAGKYKESGTPTRAWLGFEKSELKKVVDDMYDLFISDVSKARGLNKSEHTIFADAHIFTARQAKKVGLIDAVGSIDYAHKRLLLLSKLDKLVWQEKEEEGIDTIKALLQSSFNEAIGSYMFGYGYFR
jgi:protease-4